MRVLVVTNMYPDERYPFFGTFVREHVDSVRKRGIDVEVFVTNARYGKDIYVRSLPRLRARMATGGHDLIHAQHTFSVLQVKTLQMVVPHRVPLLLTFHEGETFVPPTTENPAARGVKRLVYAHAPKRLALSFVDALVTVEERLPSLLKYEKPFDVIPPGVDIDLFKPMDTLESRRALGWEPRRQYVFFPASPSRSFLKGYDLFEACKEHLTAEDVEFVTGGEIPHAEMPVYMNASDVVVQTSRYEASPMVVKEAMACNRPVVATPVGDVSKIMADLPGHFITTFDAARIAGDIRRALTCDGRPTQGRRRIEGLGLSLTCAAEKYEEIYRRLAQRAS